MSKKTSDRRTSIIELIASDGRMSVDYLAQAFGVSPETIRRDLGNLDARGLVRKVHGGALPPLLHSEGTFSERMVEDPKAKQIIAKKLRDIIQPGDTVFMDTGSTTLIAAEALVMTHGLTVITNSLSIAMVFGRADVDTHIYLLGGKYAPGNDQTIGPTALEQITQFQVDHAIITVAGLDADIGATDANVDEAHIARAMMKRANNTVVLATSSKIGRRAAFRVCELGGIGTVLSEGPPGPAMMEAFLRAGVSVP
ncbi:DeoR/GlpR family DNA-binding transcription regulator [Hwanghaeella sp. 1Z406]|uniref:DeoR/GlpR family DNA-binding transcription regulator n=1 Tax=Hwanghaeella sp. 1Z406 TaxID=3402811 RepID=UPI0026CEFCDB